MAKKSASTKRRLPPIAPGQRYGKLVSVQFVELNRHGQSRWRFQCDCGESHTTDTNAVRRGKINSCGCLKRSEPTPGERFGRLTAISQVTKRGPTKWLFQCDCGKKKAIFLHPLRSGLIVSCGCFQREVAKIAGRKNATHGKSGTSEFGIWSAMKKRCEPSTSHLEIYKNWAGKGITVCERWKDSFSNFLSDMGERPSVKHTIDRIDGNGNYEPGNCRWATRKEQARNMRTNLIVEYQGRQMCLAEAVELSGIAYSVVQARLIRGWSVFRALSEKVRK